MGLRVVETNSEEQAVLDVVKAETRAYFEKNFQAWADCWLHNPNIGKLVRNFDGEIAKVDGWDKFWPGMKQSMQLEPTPSPSMETMRWENIITTISGDFAEIRYDQIGEDTGDVFDQIGLKYESRTLLRQDGRWRILNAVSVQSRSDNRDTRWIGVSPNGDIETMPATARAALNASKYLINRHGRLTVRTKNGAADLTALLGWADELITSRRNTALLGGISMFQRIRPLVLGDETDDVREICWIIVEGNEIYVSPADDHRTDSSLDAAVDIFGLSETQLRLAREICSGKDLADAAEQLGVTINTVRTHLQRIFDKTGVRSQHALVNVLLANAPPGPLARP